MARRGEGQFVCSELNLRNDPKVRTLARNLKIHPQRAVGLLSDWKEFVLTKGTAGGVVRGYTAGDITGFLDWEGRPDKLLAEMKLAGYLATRRGEVYVYPFWGDTPTGWYATKRAADRDRKRQGTSAESPRNGHAGSAPVPDRSVQGEREATPPGGPPSGGVGVAGARIGLAEWFWETHPRPRNESECRRLCGAMTEVQAVQLRYCLPRQLRKYIAGMTNRNGRGVPWADKYLRDGFWCEIRPPKPKAEKNGQSRAEEQQEKSDLVEREKAWWGRRDMVREQLKAAGVRLPKHELEARIDEELAKEDGGQPS